MWRRFRDLLAFLLLSAVYRALSFTWRVTHIRRPENFASTNLLYAHWHGDELCLISVYRHSRMAVMASRSRDGELQARFLKSLGYHVVRGSSSRGGAGGLKGLLDAVKKQKFNASLAVDGPRGPIYQVKAGILKLAQVTGVPLIPGAVGVSSRFVFKKSWNLAFLPAPFADCRIVYGQPVLIPRGASEAELESLRADLENQLLFLKREAEALFHRDFRPAPNRPAVDLHQ